MARDHPEVALAALVEAAEGLVLLGRSPVIRGIAYHSQSVKPGDLFVCIRGRKDDGHRYAREAVARGAAALETGHCRDD